MGEGSGQQGRTWAFPPGRWDLWRAVDRGWKDLLQLLTGALRWPLWGKGGRMVKAGAWEQGGWEGSGRSGPGGRGWAGPGAGREGRGVGRFQTGLKLGQIDSAHWRQREEKQGVKND